MQQVEEKQPEHESPAVTFQPLTLRPGSISSRRRISLLPAYPLGRNEADRRALFLLANVFGVDRDQCEKDSFCGGYGICAFGFKENRFMEPINSFMIDLYRDLFLEPSRQWKLEHSLIDYNLSQRRKCMDLYTQQTNEAALLSFNEMPMALEFFFQIDVNVFYMKTCHFRGAHPRLFGPNGDQPEGILCEVRPTARYRMRRFYDKNCFLCQSQRAETDDLSDTGVHFTPHPIHLFVNKYEAILNCPADCNTSNVIYALTCPCEQCDFIGSTSISFHDRMLKHRDDNNRIIREFLIGPKNVEHMFKQEALSNNKPANNDTSLYQHLPCCAIVLQRFLNKNPDYWPFVPMLWHDATTDDKAMASSTSSTSKRSTTVPATRSAFAAPESPTFAVQPTFFHEVLRNTTPSNEECTWLSKSVQKPPSGYRFSNRQIEEQMNFFKFKKESQIHSSHLIDCYTTPSVDFKASWLFDVHFSFLPVNRLVVHLTLKDQETCGTRTCVHGSCRKYLNSPHREYCQCEPNWSGRHCNLTNICLCAKGGKCVDRYPTPICVCPLGRMGSECQVLFNPCSDVNCQHDETCLPLDERQSTKLFTCSCRSGYYGSRCEYVDARIDIHFSDSLFPHNRPVSAAVFVYFLELKNDSPGILFVQNRLLHKQVRLNKLFGVLNSDRKYLSSFILLQIFFEPDNYGYYIAAIIKSNMTTILTTIYESNRCPHVNELLLNETIRGFPSRKKVKYYRRACEVSNSIKWFHDETYLCFCDKDRRSDCLFFQQEPTQCTTDYCKNNGRCVQNNFNGIWDFGCVCDGCGYGSLCQLTTSQYALSLDAMLGQDIIENVPLSGQPFLVKLVLTVLDLMLSLGFVSNILSLMTFKQLKVREFGCGVYLFCLPIIGQFGLTVFAGRVFYLLGTQLYDVNHHSATLWSCISLEYFLSVCPMLFDWLTACVAVERSVNIIKGALFKKANSVWWAKRIIFLLTTIVLVSAWHEPLIRQLIDDPRATNIHAWCVVTFPWPWLEYYRLTVNLINLIVPGSINLVAMVFLLHKSTRMKQKFVKKQSKKGYFKSFKKQLPLYGSPLALVALSLMWLVFSFILVCITPQWQKYVYLTAYFISFAPLMGTFPIFVLPTKVYKTEFKNFVKQAGRKFRLTRAR